MHDPIKDLTAKEWALWLCSLLAAIVSNLLSGNVGVLTPAAVCIGITSLIFAAKGNVWSQILMIIFSILYGIISWRSHYWGEMITYLGMTLPMAVWSTITWLKNPSENGKEVAIQKLTKKHTVGLIFFGIITTAVFCFILKALDTPNIFFSTLSITTSFFAAALTMLRSPFYALGYAANDIVLIVLWISASLNDPQYIPVAVNFAIFFFNDMYGFISWKKRAELQNA